MNAFILITGFFALAAMGAAAWAVIERGRAGRAEERARLLEANAETLKAQAAQSAEAVADRLVRRATESFQAQERVVQARLEEKLKPVAETLAKFQEQVTAIEKSRAEDTGGLKVQIESLMLASAAAQEEARKLSNALRRGAGVQGRWGEQTLRNVLEAAGLSGRFDFAEQVSMDADDGRRRPDVIVKLPGNAAFAIDAKCSVNALLDAQEAIDEVSREQALLRYVQNIKAHIAGLSAKAYWDQFKDERSPDFVAMFVPADSFLSMALDRAPDLMVEAMDKRVILVTPTTLFGLCKAVAYGWRAEDQARSAARIAELGRELYKRLSVMGNHVAGVGRALEGAVGKYNQFVASLETQVLSQARRFEDLATDHESRALSEPPSVEMGVRPLAKLAATQPGDDGAVLTLESPAPTSAA